MSVTLSQHVTVKVLGDVTLLQHITVDNDYCITSCYSDSV